MARRVIGEGEVPGNAAHTAVSCARCRSDISSGRAHVGASLRGGIACARGVLRTGTHSAQAQAVSRYGQRDKSVLGDRAPSDTEHPSPNVVPTVSGLEEMSP